MGNALKIADDNFEADVKNATGLVVVDFGAEWCGPCKALEPTINELADDYAGNEAVAIAKCDVDEARDLASTLGIMSVPTIVFFKGGSVVHQVSGVQSKDALKSMIDTHSAD